MSELYTRATQLAAEQDAARRESVAKHHRERAKQLERQEELGRLSKQRIQEFVQILQEHNIDKTPLYASTPYYGGQGIGQTSKLCLVDNGWVVVEPYTDHEEYTDVPGLMLHQDATVCNEFVRDESGEAIATTSGTRIGWSEEPPELCAIEPDHTVDSGYFGSDEALHRLANALVRYGVL